MSCAAGKQVLWRLNLIFFPPRKETVIEVSNFKPVHKIKLYAQLYVTVVRHHQKGLCMNCQALLTIFQNGKVFPLKRRRDTEKIILTGM